MSEEICSICGNAGSVQMCRLPCNHKFCFVCIGKFCASSDWYCPECHQQFLRMAELQNKNETGYIISAKSLATIYQYSESNSYSSSSFHAAQPVVHSEEEPVTKPRTSTNITRVHQHQSSGILNSNMQSHARSNRSNRQGPRLFNSPHLSLFGEK
ncbi:hypothetical protein TRFO_16995 [Tritrichomonas foetus]|uniref:RING-type domain-containing protein n=1 Tax=Tritrichomonas foetus TaxID=1144522 RepID=A0A1J4KPW9_9EUKA|nr:hypothetical protein TRFO_16995 [Tritrichomonas foetus]|eukprot:OHT12944.1 hypothetical protein TRFO_16995 [Tritrichomonas foetus]